MMLVKAASTKRFLAGSRAALLCSGNASFFADRGGNSPIAPTENSGPYQDTPQCYAYTEGISEHTR